MIFLGLLFLGIKTMYVWLKGAMVHCWFKTWRHIGITHSLTTPKCFWKKIACNPSRPGAFVGYIWKSVISISSAVKRYSRRMLIYVLTFEVIPCISTLIWSLLGLEVVKRSWKYSQNLFSTSSLSSSHDPTQSSTSSILFFLLNDDALAWIFFCVFVPFFQPISSGPLLLIHLFIHQNILNLLLNTFDFIVVVVLDIILFCSLQLPH